MKRQLDTLLELRRTALEAADAALATATAARARAEAEQVRLVERWQAARSASLAVVNAGRAPATAAEAVRCDHHRQRLVRTETQAAARASAHRRGALAEAFAREQTARTAYAAAQREHDAVAKLKQRAEAVAAKRDGRRAEERASDLAATAHARRRH